MVARLYVWGSGVDLWRKNTSHIGREKNKTQENES
jgi:hypothetical protein